MFPALWRSILSEVTGVYQQRFWDFGYFIIPLLFCRYVSAVVTGYKVRVTRSCCTAQTLIYGFHMCLLSSNKTHVDLGFTITDCIILNCFVSSCKSNHSTCFLVLNSDDIMLQLLWLVEVTWCCTASFLIYYLCQWFCAVCLSVSKITHTPTEPMFLKLSGIMWCGPRKDPFHFGKDPYTTQQIMRGCWAAGSWRVFALFYWLSSFNLFYLMHQIKDKKINLYFKSFF